MLRHCLRSALTRHSPCHVSTRQLVCSSSSRYASSSSSSSPLDSSALEGVVPAHGVAPASRSDLDRRKAAFYRQLGRRGGGDLALLAKNMPPVHGREVFANSDLSLQHVSHHGYDFDFTLANYKRSLGELIYEHALDHLVRKQGYPQALLGHRAYESTFGIRGLTYDTRTGYIFKLDEFNKVAIDTVHQGLQPVPLPEMLESFGGVRLSAFYMASHCHMFSDLFAMPEISLICSITDYFINHNKTFFPPYLYADIRAAVGSVHSSGIMYAEVLKDPSRYLTPSVETKEYLNMLRENDKTLFLLTNSPFYFVNGGMSFLFGKDWRDLFDVIVTDAHKPQWFNDEGPQGRRGFREIDPSTGQVSWEQVRSLERGRVYAQGNLQDFSRMTEWQGQRVLYAGDQPFADVVEPNRGSQWRTAAIISELEHECDVQSQSGFRMNLVRSQHVYDLIQFGQTIDDAEVKSAVSALKLERNELRKRLKESLNPSFGSVFRTTDARTRFFSKVCRHSDIYLSRVSNLLNYSPTHTFYARRQYMQHEVALPSSLAFKYMR